MALAPFASATATQEPPAWATANLSGSVRLNGQVPLAVIDAGRTPMGGVESLGPVVSTGSITLNFGLPVRNEKALNALIVEEAKTHRSSAAARSMRGSRPPQAQYAALGAGSSTRVTR